MGMTLAGKSLMRELEVGAGVGLGGVVGEEVQEAVDLRLLPGRRFIGSGATVRSLLVALGRPWILRLWAIIEERLGCLEKTPVDSSPKVF